MLGAAEVRVLDRLAVAASLGAASGTASVVRRTRAHAGGIEFHDYRPYQPGDDLRSIDWTVDARLHQLVVRVSRAEGHARLHLLVDASASMGIGSTRLAPFRQPGEATKIECARRLAAALAYVAIRRRDAVALTCFGGGDVRHLPVASGPGQLSRVFHALTASTPGGATSLDDVLRRCGAAVRAPAVVVVLSDFLDAPGVVDGLRFLQHRALTPAAVQILARDELDPPVDEETELRDVERPGVTRVIVSSASVDAYQRKLQDHLARIRSTCAGNGIPYVLAAADSSFGETVAAMQTAGVFAARG